MNNLFISYDLVAPGQHYERVIEQIKTLGNWAKIELSLFYVNSTLSAEDAAKLVYSTMDQNDKLIVIDSTNNSFYSYNLNAEVLQMMQNQWNQ